jgi:mannose-6-phosphate isomerase-like protein (cupin superfamily)
MDLCFTGFERLREGSPHAEDRHRQRADRPRHELSGRIRRPLPAAPPLEAGRRRRPDPVRRQPAAPAGRGLVSQRHWHVREDEFVTVLSGEVVLVEEDGETVLRPGDCAGFKAGVPNGHKIENRSDSEAVLLEVGTRTAGDGADYPDIDMVLPEGADRYFHRDGTPYPKVDRRT